MSDEDYEAIYAITFEAPKRIGTMMASTPTGRRGKFYQASQELTFNQEDKIKPVNTKQRGYVYDKRKYNREEAEGWKEFHLPSMVNPEWSPSMEKELRSTYSEAAYEHEVLAEFGTETIGVFNKEYVDEAASRGYPFEESRRMNSPIAIGIDFDKFGSQSNIVVLQYDPFDERRARPELGSENPGFGRFKVINHIEVPKSDMHYDLTVKTVIELNERYQPFAIYPDRGAGEYQIEMLRKELGEKVKGVFYGSSIEVRDPISRIIEKKPLKPFLIGQTTLLLERGQLRIPEKETSDVIRRQMTNYQVVKVSARTQEPTYSDTDEHGLDAMVFALYAFIEEYPELVNTLESSEPARKSYITAGRKKDPLKDIYKKNSERKVLDNQLNKDPRKTKPGVTRRAIKQESGLGWGRRGSGRKSSRRGGF